MKRLPTRPHCRLLAASLVAASLAIAACDSADNPTEPSATTSTPYPTITITANGISRDLPHLIPGLPVTIVNKDSQPRRLHLDQGDQAAGCAALDVVGELRPGESRDTAPIGLDAVDCAIHDHMAHGDPRFAVRLAVDHGE